MKLFLTVTLISFVLLIGCSKKKGVELVVPPSQVETPPAQVQQDTDSGSASELDEISRKLQPVFFDYDRSEIRKDQEQVLQSNAGVLQSNQPFALTIEGHCDERGTEEYNLALGERRANAVKEYLETLGIPSDRLNTVSYGESRPFALGHNEESWHQNRRGHSVVLKSE